MDAGIVDDAGQTQFVLTFTVQRVVTQLVTIFKLLLEPTPTHLC